MKAIAVAKYLVTLFGVAMLIGAYFLYANARSFVTTASRTQGTVVSLRPQLSNNSRTYAPVVSFRVGAQQIEFKSTTGSNPPAYHIGESVPVIYSPANPYLAKIDSFFSLWGGTVIVAGIGSAFLLIGGGIMAAGPLRRRSDNRLMQEGLPIQADFQQVDLNTAVSVSGRHPFRVIAQWQDPSTAKIRVFKSHNLWFDPSRFITQKQIRVFLDRNNPKRYYVDLSFLPKQAN
jgi:hypothetical protein